MLKAGKNMVQIDDNRVVSANHPLAKQKRAQEATAKDKALPRGAKFQGAIMHIALNDEPCCLDVDEVSQQMTVVLVSEVWDVSCERVARAVIRFRKEYDI